VKVRRRALLIFVVFVSTHFLSNFLRSANATLAPFLSRDLNLDAAQLGLMTSLFYASFALIQLPAGAALDRFGSRAVTACLLWITVVGCLIFASAQSFAMAAVGRALIGIGLATVLMGAMKVYGQWFPSNRVATVSGVMTGISSTGSLIAATPLALMNDAWGWRAVFLLMIPLVIIASVAILLFVRNAPEDQPVVIAPAGTSQWSVFAQIFSDSRFWRISLLMFFLFGTMQAVQSLWIGKYLYDVQGLESTNVGNMMLCLNFGLLAGYFSSGWLAERFGNIRLMMFISGLFLCTIILLIVLGKWISLPLLGITMFFFAFCGAFNVLLLAQVREFMPAHMIGRALTAANMMGFIGTAVVQWVMGLTVGLFPADSQGVSPYIAYLAAFLIPGIGMLLAWIWYSTLLRDTQKPGPQVSAPSAS
jgi:predicted MFS family arabinose efflux permease